MLHWVLININFDAPSSVSLDDLLNVKLGEGIATVIYFSDLLAKCYKNFIVIPRELGIGSYVGIL